MLRDYLVTDWFDHLTKEFDQPYFKQLEAFLEEAYHHSTIYPEKKQIFEALNLTPFSKVKVVILGQDPYHGINQAHGLSFSVPEGEKLPPSLRNIYKELLNDIGITRTNGNLSDWAKQGVLLINDVFTVEEKKARSHRRKGWEKFTEAIFLALNQKSTPIVFILWGNDAIKKSNIISNHHLIIKGPHPSPLSSYRGFFGSRPFSKTNTYLEEMSLGKIEW